MSKPTDADLLDRETVPENTFRALTLDLATLDTANLTQRSLLFSVQGMAPTGFAVESVRFTNSGSQEMEYRLGYQQSGGESAACDALEVRVLRDWSVVQKTSLPSINLSATLKPGSHQQVVLAVGLETTDPNLQNKNCLFNLAVTARPKNATGRGIEFSDEEIIQNQVGFGSWLASSQSGN